MREHDRAVIVAGQHHLKANASVRTRRGALSGNRTPRPSEVHLGYRTAGGCGSGLGFRLCCLSAVRRIAAASLTRRGPGKEARTSTPRTPCRRSLLLGCALMIAVNRLARLAKPLRKDRISGARYRRVPQRVERVEQIDSGLDPEPTDQALHPLIREPATRARAEERSPRIEAFVLRNRVPLEFE